MKAAELLKRPNITYKILQEIDETTAELNVARDIYEQVEVLIKYEGYLKRQTYQVEQAGKLDKFRIPDDIDYDKIDHISSETKDKLKKNPSENSGSGFSYRWG